MPVKYSSDDPASTSRAPTFSRCIRSCSLATRAACSSGVIGLAPATGAPPASVGGDSPNAWAFASQAPAAAAPRKKRRLSVFIPPDYRETRRPLNEIQSTVTMTLPRARPVSR